MFKFDIKEISKEDALKMIQKYGQEVLAEIEELKAKSALYFRSRHERRTIVEQPKRGI